MSRSSQQWLARPDLPDDHYVDVDIYTSQQIFDDELKNIFAKTWKFACHESEIPNLGDYRALNHAGIPVFVIRGEDGSVRAFVNACPHRGSKLVTDVRGNAKNLTCFFHLWTFDDKGRCIEITREDGYAQSGVCKGKQGLRRIRCHNKFGMLFINLDDDADEFDRHVGNVMDCLEEVMTTKPLEVFHHHQVRMNANWKQWHETNMELYHEWGHIVNRSTAIAADGYHNRTWCIHENGHGTLDPMEVSYDNYKGWETRSGHLLPGLGPGELRMVDLFPNTTILVRATAIRIDTSTPIAPGITLLEQRGLGILGEPEQDRKVRVKHHNEIWGPLGRNLAEDVIFVETVSETHRREASKWGLFARHEGLKAQDDEIMRAYYRVWGRMMGKSASNPLG
ncbi:Rieske [2Fe-2S] domain protein [Bordetella bronchiseptica MBORD675]|uniref:aromatic ring-hydroxylating oxygenase subunit alpha n=1 Tax=Bordetella bronchiseptica TaxID=518 RepID=UPI00028FBC82|nr:aromatic ring-hydroxylating dioxygenase subunit alpha [Bordetella bronchiseptica]AWQ03681.1 ring-hydroxylating oxygenase subunit alpha [Bordetella bronchiseptica]KDC99355.1 Rieske [2Fe-2S] domain protein [Bordetella bronchiseptica MBORD675]KDD17999.1 Rieske [2Fe-2S] domain protein [Bordetella bronchiseptica MBORD707]QIY01360.1 Rieske 2Fe-2S domain-containing protein [Bordetella bronchiseptica]CCN04260.1 putative dioxygenase subunit [Bordetella bronchiseptica Bbr77]